MATDLRQKYAKFDRIVDDEGEEEEEEEEWRLSESEKKARREKKRDKLIKEELEKYKEIDEKLEKAAKQPARINTEYRPVPEAPASWSEGRKSAKNEEEDNKKLREAWETVEAILKQYAKDESFQSDLQRPKVLKAIHHWTNKHRLPKEESDSLFDEDSFEFQQFLKPTLTKLSKLQIACKRANIGVPIDAVLSGRSTIFLPQKKEVPPVLSEKEKRALARKEFEAKIMSDLPPVQPFSWRRFAKNTLMQIVFMVIAMLYFHFYMKPDLEEQSSKIRDGQENLPSMSSSPAGTESDFFFTDNEEEYEEREL